MAQSSYVTIEGYVFESGNRGYLNLVKVTAFDKETKAIRSKSVSNADGVFILQVPANGEYIVRAEKDVFDNKEALVSTINMQPGEKTFVKLQMERKPGYVFDVTIAETRLEDEPVDAVTNTQIEVFNVTKDREELVLPKHPIPTFKVAFEQGNHYAILIRKKGYFNKRMDAFVNVKGCILCFEGVGDVKPGVSDVLTEGNTMGTLLANVELQPIELNKGIKVENIYYDLDKSEIRKDAAEELDNLAGVLKINPHLVIELGSHTDSRGSDKYNLKLSDERAKEAVSYLTTVGGIDETRIVAKGYGETQLTNKCKNGVDCSSRQHQQNRRTEIKVIGYTEQDEFQNKTLAQIIKDEKFEQMLAEVQNSEVVRVKPGEEPPVDETKTVTDTIPTKEEASESMQTTVTDLEKEPKPAQADETGMVLSNPVEPGTTEEKVVLSTPISPDNPTGVVTPSAFDAQVNAPDSTLADRIAIDETLPEGDFATSEEDFGSTAASGDAAEDLLSNEIPVNTNPLVRGPKAVEKGYNGYRVEFYTSPYELPVSHEIFTRHGNITMQQTKEGMYSYMLGEFNEWRDANAFLNNIILGRYPQGKVVRYKRGRRVK